MTKTWAITTAAGVVLTMIVTALVTRVLTTYERGEAALTVDQIKVVLESEGLTTEAIKDAVASSMTTDIDGQTLTYGQALSKIDRQLAILETNQRTLTRAVESLAE